MTRHLRPRLCAVGVTCIGTALVASAIIGNSQTTPEHLANTHPPSASPALRSAPVCAGSTGGSSSAEDRSADAPPSAEVANPDRIRIPAIEVDAAVIPLGIRVDGTIEVPEDDERTGWWADGPEPGEPGPAVILGHVDSVEGPAVFSRLPGLAVGELIHIDRVDGSSLSYRVDHIQQHPKNDFPTEEVYGRAGSDSVLRLVTCGGEFDRDERSYVDNVIVFASLASAPAKHPPVRPSPGTSAPDR